MISLIELGIVRSTEAGVVGLDYQEMWAWQKSTKQFLTPLEAGWLHQMSAAYASELRRSSGKKTSPPYTMETGD